MSLTITRMQINFLPSWFHWVVFPAVLESMITAGWLIEDQWNSFLWTRLLLISDDCHSYSPQATSCIIYNWNNQGSFANTQWAQVTFCCNHSTSLRFNVYSGEDLQYGTKFAPLIAVYWGRKACVFLATSSCLPASEVSFSSFMDVLHRVDKARWMTAALFGPVGSETNNPIMLPGDMQRAACQEHSAV